jgi:hypothetical protein
MSAFAEYLKSRASGRAVAGTVLFALLILVLQYGVLIPHFQAATGLKPFDMQFPLTKYMIAIQLGTYPPGAGTAYLPFLLIDLLLAIVSAAALMLLWSWLFRQRSSGPFSFLERGGVTLVPVYTLVCDIAENIAFARLVGGGLSPDSHAGTIEFAVTIHSVHGAFLDLQMILTVLFVILFGLAAGKQERAGTAQGG